MHFKLLDETGAFCGIQDDGWMTDRPNLVDCKDCLARFQPQTQPVPGALDAVWRDYRQRMQRARDQRLDVRSYADLMYPALVRAQGKLTKDEFTQLGRLEARWHEEGYPS